MSLMLKLVVDQLAITIGLMLNWKVSKHTIIKFIKYQIKISFSNSDALVEALYITNSK
jgi:hypothetical protein